MLNLINVINSTIILFLVFTSFGQGKKKYLKRNKKPETFTYADSSIYARGLYNDSNIFFVGNSDGSLYYIDIITKKSQLLFQIADFTEMRDVERSNKFILGIQSGDNGRIYRLESSGKYSITELPEWKGVFFDAMDFKDELGFIMGDPVDGKITLFHTMNSGETWERCEGEVEAIKDEAGFAASGTNVQILNDSTYVFITGGMQSRFLKSTDNGKTWTGTVLPYYPGESTGAYSICFSSDSIGVIVGGDYSDPDIKLNSTFYTYDGGDSWFNSKRNPRGYRSCVYYTEGVYYACGRNGIDFSLNNGRDWIPFANGAYFTLQSYSNKLVATTKYGTLVQFNLIDKKKETRPKHGFVLMN